MTSLELFKAFKEEIKREILEELKNDLKLLLKKEVKNIKVDLENYIDNLNSPKLSFKERRVLNQTIKKKQTKPKSSQQLSDSTSIEINDVDSDSESELDKKGWDSCSDSIKLKKNAGWESGYDSYSD